MIHTTTPHDDTPFSETNPLIEVGSDNTGGGGMLVTLTRGKKLFIVLQGFITLTIAFSEPSSLAITSNDIINYYNWDTSKQGAIMSATFFGGLVMQLIMGTLVNTLGARIMISVCMLVCGALSFLVPLAANTHFMLLLADRAIAGALLTVAIPAALAIVGHWIPEDDRGAACAWVFLGATVGVAGGQFLTGFAVTYLTWQKVFYIIGCLELSWGVIGFLIIRNQPPQLRHTLEDEKPLEEEARLGLMGIIRVMKELLQMRALWAVVISTFASDWTNSIITSWMPTYLQAVFTDMAPEKAGSITSLPVFAASASALAAGNLSDWLLKKHQNNELPWRFKSPVRVVRLFWNSLGQGLYAVCVALIPVCVTSKNIPAIIAVLILAWTTGGLSGAGHSTSNVDVCPKHTAIVCGLTQTVSALASLVSVYLTGLLVVHTGSWELIFYLSGGLLILGGTVFALWGNIGLENNNDGNQNANYQDDDVE